MAENGHYGQTVPPFIARLLVAAGEAAGVDRGSLARIPGLVALGDDGVRIPTTSIIRVWQELERPLREIGGGVRLSRAWRPGALGAWDYLFATADTLTAAFRVAGRHLASVTEAEDTYEVVRDESGMTVTYRARYEDHASYLAISEFAVAQMLLEARTGAGRPLRPSSVRLPSRPPIRHGNLVDAFGTRNIDFDAPHPSITFTEADADRPLPRADAALAAILARHAEVTVAAARPILGWLDRFHAEVDKGFAAGGPDLACVAHRLGLSPRSLQRRLLREGTSWREELERIRQRQVDHLLRHTSLTVESIAGRVGYTDPRALRRAIHRWYGHGPAKVRAT